MESKSFDGYHYTVDEHGHVYHQGHTTDPYGRLTFTIGSEEDFVCFDYMILERHVALHAVLNSETGAFIQDFDYGVLKFEDAVAAAEEMVANARGWCIENDVPYNDEDSDHGHSFPERLASSLMFKRYDQDHADGLDSYDGGDAFLY